MSRATLVRLENFSMRRSKTANDASHVRYYGVDRDIDATGTSGTGRVAYAIELPSGALLVWDTQWVTIDWRPNMATLEAINGHNGATRFTPLDDDPAARKRAMELLLQANAPAFTTFAEASALLTAKATPPKLAAK